MTHRSGCPVASGSLLYGSLPLNDPVSGTSLLQDAQSVTSATHLLLPLSSKLPHPTSCPLPPADNCKLSVGRTRLRGLRTSYHGPTVISCPRPQPPGLMLSLTAFRSFILASHCAWGPCACSPCSGWRSALCPSKGALLLVPVFISEANKAFFFFFFLQSWFIITRFKYLIKISPPPSVPQLKGFFLSSKMLQSGLCRGNLS